MIQGGCPQGRGTGGPGYEFADECEGNPHKVARHAICMANAGPNTNGSQFFIVTAAACPWLDGKHTTFGRIVEGTEVIDEIGSCRTGPGDRPAQEQKIVRVSVIRKRGHEYKVNRL
jgi:cyclophilin family peptidyl-prolyl cis-trans isomerase